MSKRIGFYLLGFKGFKALGRYLETYSSSTIEFVSIGRDKGVDNDYYNELLELCQLSLIPVIEREQLSKMEFKPDTIRVAIGWKWLIEKTDNLVIFHDSLLPKYRGFAPVVSALIDSEKTIGVTALWANADYDVGDIISQREIEISYPIKIKTVIENIAPLYEELLLEIACQFYLGLSINAKKQVEADATYSVWRDDKDYEVPWSRDSDYIKRLIDAVGTPYEGATSFLKGRKIKIFDAEVIDDVVISDRQRHVGKVIKIINKKPVVICGQGLIKLTEFSDVEANKTPVFNFRSRFGV